MAWLRHSSPSQVIRELSFYQVTGKLVTQHNKMTRDGNPVLRRKVDWRRLLLHYKNVEKNTPEDSQGANSSIQQNKQHSTHPDQPNLLYYLHIYFSFQAVEHFVICAYRASWNLGSEGGEGKKTKKGGKIVPAYIKLVQLNLPKYPVCIGFR